MMVTKPTEYALAQISFTGMNGLAPDYMGDLNDTTATPTKRYLGVDGQVADGIYDPLRLAGYIAPANNTYADLTGTITDSFISRVYASSIDRLYIAQAGVKYSYADGLDATTFTTVTHLSGQSEFKDLELYQINDEEAIFYLYKNINSAVSDVPNINLGWMTLDTSRGAFQLAAKVYGTLDLSDTYEESIASAGNERLAQKFISSDLYTQDSIKVTGVRLRLKMPYVGTTQAWTLQLTIETSTADRPSGTPVTNATVTMDPNDLPIGAYDYVYFTFSDTVTLSAGTIYHIVIQPTNFAQIGTDEGVNWLRSDNANSLYANGQAEKYIAAAWADCDSTDESFDFALVLNRYDFAGFTFQDTQMTIGDTGSDYEAAGNSASFNLDVSGVSNNAIIVGVDIGAAGRTVAVTCDGNAMTTTGASTGGGHELQLFYINGQNTGTLSIAVTVDGAATTIDTMGAVYYGVDQTTPFDADGGGTSGSASSVAVAVDVPASGGIPVAFVRGTTGSVTLTAGSGTTRRMIDAGDNATALFDSNAQQEFGTYTLNVSSSGATTWAFRRGTLRKASAANLPTIPPFVQADDTSAFMQKADNGFNYLFTNNRVHKFDGGTSGGDFGIFTADVLNFPSYFTIVDAVDTNSIMYMAVQTSEGTLPDYRVFGADTMGVYAWDRQSSSTSMRNWIPIYGAREVRKIFVNAEGDLRVITIGEDRFTEIRAIQSGKLVVIRRLGLNAFPRLRDSVDVLNNMATWLGNDGLVYALGSTPSKASEQLYKIGTINGEVSGTLTSGILFVGNEESTQSREGVFISWADNSKTLTKWYPHGVGTINSVAQKGNQGDVYTLAYEFPKFSNVGYIHFYGLPMADDGAGNTTQVATLKVYFNKSSTVRQTWNITRKDMLDGFIYFPLNKKGIFAVQFEVEFSTSQTLGANDFTPNRVVVAYDPTVHQLK